MQNPKRKRYQKDSAPTDDIFTLINLVRQNPALYNYKLQPNQRRRVDVLVGWAHVAAQIGNKYTVEECRRKWKNLRDTYHQYRLRKPRLGDGLSKWRYAKDLEFLSNIYQPKLKSNRNPSYDLTTEQVAETIKKHESEHEASIANAMVEQHHSTIALVNDDAETFILAYEESVPTMTHEDASSISHMELTHSEDVENVVEIVKNEHVTQLDEDDDDDGATGAEVDYEEVCLYEEAGNAPSVDCETIIGSATSAVVRSTSPDSKAFQYIDANDFCIESINPHTGQLSSGGSGSSSVIGGIKLKSISSSSVVNSGNVTVVNTSNLNNNHNVTCVPATSITPTVMQLPSATTISTPYSVASSATIGSSITLATTAASSYAQTQTREELDLFFDFLKKKMQRFSKQEITAIQVEFLNCVLRREASNSQKNQQIMQ